MNFLYDDIVHALGNKKEKDKTNSYKPTIKFTSLVESIHMPTAAKSVFHDYRLAHKFRHWFVARHDTLNEIKLD